MSFRRFCNVCSRSTKSPVGRRTTSQWIGTVFVGGLHGAMLLTSPQLAAAQEAVLPIKQLPSLLRWERAHPVYGGPDDILNRVADLKSQEDGESYLLELAHRGDINIIAQVPAHTLESPQPQVQVSPKLHMRLLEIQRDCHLVWHRTAERTVLMWPEPDEEDVGRSWTELFAQQQEEEGLGATLSLASVESALQRLKLPSNDEARRRLIQDYVEGETRRIERRLGAAVDKHLRQQGHAPQKGDALAWLELPQDIRADSARLLHVYTHGARNHPTWLWFYPERRQAFWRGARLRIGTPAEGRYGGGGRPLILSGTDGSGKPLDLSIGYYDPFTIAPDTIRVSATTPPPRPTGGVAIEGRRLTLSQVLAQAQKQSGMSLAAPLNRLRDARLTLSVRGMSTRDFLQALSRVFLIEWHIEGKKAIAQDIVSSPADRSLLRLGDPYQYRFLTMKGRDDRQEELTLSRALYQEVGDELFNPKGVPVTQLSKEAQDGLRREGQEAAFEPLVSLALKFVPAALDEATLHVAHVGPLMMVPSGQLPRKAATPADTDPFALALPLRTDYHPSRLSVVLAQPTRQPLMLAALPEGDALSRPEAEPPNDPVERLIAAYTRAQTERDEQADELRNLAEQERMRELEETNRARPRT